MLVCNDRYMFICNVKHWYKKYLWLVYDLNIFSNFDWQHCIFDSTYVHLSKDLRLLYSFQGDLPENGHVDAETCRGHIAKWETIFCCWLYNCWIKCCTVCLLHRMWTTLNILQCWKKYDATLRNTTWEATQAINIGMPITVPSPSKRTTNIKIHGVIKVPNLVQKIRYHMKLVLT